MRGDTRCIDGRLYRHDPQFDDPDLETEIGQCPECEGKGCPDPNACVDCGEVGNCKPGCPSRLDDEEEDENAAERAWENQQERLMEDGPGPSLLDQQIEAMKLK